MGASLLAKASSMSLCHTARLIFEAVVEERLPAAGLFRRETDLHPQALQQAHHVLQGVGVKLVAQAGDEELGFGHAGQAQKMSCETWKALQISRISSGFRPSAISLLLRLRAS